MTRTAEQITTAQTLIADSRAFIERLYKDWTESLHGGKLAPECYVVQNPAGFGIEFQFSRGTAIGCTVHGGGPRERQLFTKEHAEKLAQKIENGHGEKGIAVHIDDAYREAIKSQIELIHMLEEQIVRVGGDTMSIKGDIDFAETMTETVDKIERRQSAQN